MIEPTCLSFSAWQLIIHIHVFSQNNNDRGMTTAELAEDFLISRQAILKQIKSLIMDGYIVTKENCVDKRSPYYCVSLKGKELCEYVIQEIYGDWMLESMQGFSDAEIEAATKILIHLTKV